LAKNTKNNKKKKLHPEFEREIPSTIRYDIEEAVDQTRKTGREHSLTFCTIKGKDRGKVFTADGVKGDKDSTSIADCSKTGGNKVGDLHTHPADDISIGTTPSEADFYGTLEDTRDIGKRQFSCITNNGSKFIHCYTPKGIPNRTKLQKYRKALYNTGDLNDVDPYFRDSIHKDFEHVYYDRKTYKRVSPDPGDIVTDAFGKSKRLRGRDLKAIEKGTFCDLIQDYTAPGNNRVGSECRDRLQKRTFLPFTSAQIQELKKIHRYFFT